ncbi:MAG: RNA polymerase sigma factor [Mangrovibacterium sp.]
MDEARLIRGIQQRDHNSFRILVGLYQRMVVNTCFGIVHNRADAEDLAQEVFLEIFTSAGDFRGDAKLSTWIYRVALKPISKPGTEPKTPRFFFSRWKTPLPEEKTKTGKLPYIPAINPTEKFPSRQRTDILHHAIDRLPEKQRIAFTLNKYEELSYKQIAEVMKISLSSGRDINSPGKDEPSKATLYLLPKKVHLNASF